METKSISSTVGGYFAHKQITVELMYPRNIKRPNRTNSNKITYGLKHTLGTKGTRIHSERQQHDGWKTRGSENRYSEWKSSGT